jgi:hypothetical protein
MSRSIDYGSNPCESTTIAGEHLSSYAHTTTYKAASAVNRPIAGGIVPVKLLFRKNSAVNCALVEEIVPAN